MHNADEIFNILRDEDPDQESSIRFDNASPADNLGRCFSWLRSAPHEQETLAVTSASSRHRGTWRDKLRDMWDKIVATQYPSHLPPTPTTIPPHLLSVGSLRSVFDHEQDVLPRPGDAGTIVREKMIHSGGAVARVTLEIDSTGSPWTGMLASGSTTRGLLRVSNGSGDNGPFSPGVAVKFPRTDLASVDMLFGAPFALGPTLTHAQFLTVRLRTWLGKIPTGSEYRDIRTLFWLFNRVRQGQGCSGFSSTALSPEPLCQALQDVGTSSAGGNVRSPGGLILVPMEPARTAWARVLEHSEDHDDFRKIFLAAFSTDSPVQLYRVLARDSDGETAIGTMTLMSRFVCSRFGDEKLFFRHPIQCPDATVAGT